MRLDPGYGNVMMGTNLLKKATDVLNDVLVAARLDGDNPEEAHAVLAIGDQVEASANRRGGEPVRDKNPVVGMVKRADFTGVVGRTEGPDPIRCGQVRNHGPQSDTGGAKALVRKTPHPAQSRPCKRSHPEKGAGSGLG